MIKENKIILDTVH